ncbi:MAG: hypothetical protein FWD66_02780 [Paludibacter sp.]|nr:hypothetical protein [Paludibacter sp.]
MKKKLLLLSAGIFFGLALIFFYYKITENKTQDLQPDSSAISINAQISDLQENNTSEKSLSIYQLTEEKRVIAFLKGNRRLPDCYITKQEAQRKGWDASQGNLCDVLPGRAIGGDHFSNREKSLPAKNGRQYFEADVNYNCSNRGADRIVFSNDGLIFLTHNHYKTFEKQ